MSDFVDVFIWQNYLLRCNISIIKMYFFINNCMVEMRFCTYFQYIILCDCEIIKEQVYVQKSEI